MDSERGQITEQSELDVQARSIVEWINLNDISENIGDIMDLSDGVTLAQIFVRIHPASAHLLAAIDEDATDSVARKAQNLSLLSGGIQKFLGSRVRNESFAFTDTIITPRKVQKEGRITRPKLQLFSYDTVNSKESLVHLSTSVLICAIQCPTRDVFLNRIKADLSVPTRRILAGMVSESGGDSLGDLVYCEKGRSFSQGSLNFGDSLMSVGERKGSIHYDSIKERQGSIHYDDLTIHIPRDTHTHTHPIQSEEQISRSDPYALKVRLAEYASVFQDQQQELRTIRDENVFLNGELDKLFEVSMGILATNAEVRTENEEKVLEIVRMERMLESAEQGVIECGQLSTENDQLKKSLKMAKKELDELRVLEVESRAAMEEYKTLHKKARADCDRMNEERDKLQEKMKENEVSLQGMDRLKNAATQNVDLVKENNTLQERLTEMGTFNEKLQNTIQEQTNLMQNVKKFKERHAAMEIQNQRDMRNIAILEEKVKESEEMVEELEEQLESELGRNQRMQDQINTLKAERDRMKLNDSTLVGKLERRGSIKSLEDQFRSTIMSEISALKGENSRLSSLNSELNNKLAVMELNSVDLNRRSSGSFLLRRRMSSTVSVKKGTNVRVTEDREKEGEDEKEDKIFEEPLQVSDLAQSSIAPPQEPIHQTTDPMLQMFLEQVSKAYSIPFYDLKAQIQNYGDLSCDDFERVRLFIREQKMTEHKEETAQKSDRLSRVHQSIINKSGLTLSKESEPGAVVAFWLLMFLVIMLALSVFTRMQDSVDIFGGRFCRRPT